MEPDTCEGLDSVNYVCECVCVLAPAGLAVFCFSSIYSSAVLVGSNLIACAQEGQASWWIILTYSECGVADK